MDSTRTPGNDKTHPDLPFTTVQYKHGTNVLEIPRVTSDRPVSHCGCVWTTPDCLCVIKGINWYFIISAALPVIEDLNTNRVKSEWKTLIKTLPTKATTSSKSSPQADVKYPNKKILQTQEQLLLLLPHRSVALSRHCTSCAYMASALPQCSPMLLYCLYSSQIESRRVLYSLHCLLNPLDSEWDNPKDAGHAVTRLL